MHLLATGNCHLHQITCNGGPGWYPLAPTPPHLGLQVLHLPPQLPAAGSGHVQRPQQKLLNPHPLPLPLHLLLLLDARRFAGRAGSGTNAAAGRWPQQQDDLVVMPRRQHGASAASPAVFLWEQQLRQGARR